MDGGFLRYLPIIAMVVLTFPMIATAKSKDVTQLRQMVKWQKKQTWRWQDIMLTKHTPHAKHEQRTKSTKYLRWLVRHWKVRHLAARIKASKPPHYYEWLCIHKYEGSWSDPSAPYYGGLQMDMSFMRAYGWNLLRRKGTADHWTPLEQMWVAERAYASGRGFHPWPNTARYCGLI